MRHEEITLTVHEHIACLSFIHDLDPDVIQSKLITVVMSHQILETFINYPVLVHHG